MRRTAMAMGALALMFLAGALPADAQPQLFFEAAEAALGDTATLKLSVSGAEEPFRGVNVKFSLPPGVTVLSVEPGDLLSAAFTLDSHSFVDDETTMQTAFAYSLDDTIGTDPGSLLHFVIQVSTDPILVGLGESEMAVQPIAILGSGMSALDAETALEHGTANGAITIYAQGSPSLVVSPASLALPPEQGTTSIAVSNTGTGDISWNATVTTGSAWLTISAGASGLDDGVVSLDYTRNRVETERTATVEIDGGAVEGSPVQVDVVQAGTAAGTDNDGDGLLDLWEEEYFGDTATVSGDDDSDGDGSTNLEEFLGGTDPTDPYDAPAVGIVEVTPAAVLVVGGSPITVKGPAYNAECQVLVNGQVCTGLTYNEAEHALSAIVPPGVAGAATVRVEDPNAGTNAEVTDSLVYTANPFADGADMTANTVRTWTMAQGVVQHVYLSDGAAAELTTPQGIALILPAALRAGYDAGFVIVYSVSILPEPYLGETIGIPDQYTIVTPVFDIGGLVLNAGAGETLEIDEPFDEAVTVTLPIPAGSEAGEIYGGFIETHLDENLVPFFGDEPPLELGLSADPLEIDAESKTVSMAVYDFTSYAGLLSGPVEGETVAIPGTPEPSDTGPYSTDVSYTFSTSGAVSSLGHPVEYAFNWSDGTTPFFSVSTSASHAWSEPGEKTLTVTARCGYHNEVTNTSSPIAITIGVQPGEGEGAGEGAAEGTGEGEGQGDGGGGGGGGCATTTLGLSGTLGTPGDLLLLVLVVLVLRAEGKRRRRRRRRAA